MTSFRYSHDPTPGILVVLPVISQHTADVCVESLLRSDSAAGLTRDQILVVDNSREGWAR